MSYSVDELFDFYEIDGGYYVGRYLKQDDPSVTEVEIPAEYKSRPVIEIGWECFQNCKYLRRVYIPDSVRHIEMEGFFACDELREIRLPQGISFRGPAFVWCPKLNPETVIIGSSGHFDNSVGPPKSDSDIEWDDFLRPDVLALAIKLDCFREIGTWRIFIEIVERGLFAQIEMLQQAGIFPNAEYMDIYIERSVENQTPEMTAYLLELKRRRFGFNGGDDFEL